MSPEDEVSVPAAFALSDDGAAAAEPVLVEDRAATAVLTVRRTNDEVVVVLPVPAAAVVAASAVADSVDKRDCADSAAVEAAGRATFGRGADRLVDDVEDDDPAGRLSFSLDFHILPFPCLSGQST